MYRRRISRLSWGIQLAVTMLLAIVPTFCLETCCCVAQDVCCCLAEPDRHSPDCLGSSSCSESSSCCKSMPQSTSHCCGGDAGCSSSDSSKSSEKDGSSQGCENCGRSFELKPFEHRVFGIGLAESESPAIVFQPRVCKTLAVPTVCVSSHQRRQAQLGVWIE